MSLRPNTAPAVATRKPLRGTTGVSVTTSNGKPPLVPQEASHDGSLPVPQGVQPLAPGHTRGTPPQKLHNAPHSAEKEPEGGMTPYISVEVDMDRNMSSCSETGGSEVGMTTQRSEAATPPGHDPQPYTPEMEGAATSYQRTTVVPTTQSDASAVAGLPPQALLRRPHSANGALGYSKPTGPNSHARLSPLFPGLHTPTEKPTTDTGSDNAKDVPLSAIPDPEEYYRLLCAETRNPKAGSIRNGVTPNSAVLKGLRPKAQQPAAASLQDGGDVMLTQVPAVLTEWDPNSVVFVGEPRNSVEEANLSTTKLRGPSTGTDRSYSTSTMGAATLSSPTSNTDPSFPSPLHVITLPKLSWQHRFYVFPSITTFDVGNCMLGSQGCQPVFSLIKHLVHLEELILKGNNLGNDAAVVLVDEVLTTTTFLEDNAQGSRPSGLDVPPHSGTKRSRKVLRHPFLHSVDLSDNSVSTVGAKHCFHSFLCSTGSPQMCGYFKVEGDMVNAGLVKRFVAQCAANAAKLEEEAKLLTHAQSDISIGGVGRQSSSTTPGTAGWLSPPAVSPVKTPIVAVVPAPRAVVEDQIKKPSDSTPRSHSGWMWGWEMTF